MISHISHFTNLSEKPFVLHPIPQKNELLSSWLVRVSLAHNTHPWTFMNMHFPKYKNIIFSRDLDVWAPDELIDMIVFKSHFTKEQIEALSLKSYSGQLIPSITDSGRNTFIAPIKARRRRNQLFGQRFCPLCLKEDETSYFKREWRLTFFTVCIKHQCYLLDRCPQCFTPLSIYKFVANKGYTHCYKCHNRLKDVDITAANLSQTASKNIYSVLEQGGIEIDGKLISSVEFFRQLNIVIRTNKIGGKVDVPKILDNMSIVELNTLFFQAYHFLKSTRLKLFNIL